MGREFAHLLAEIPVLDPPVILEVFSNDRPRALTIMIDVGTIPYQSRTNFRGNRRASGRVLTSIWDIIPMMIRIPGTLSI